MTAWQSPLRLGLLGCGSGGRRYLRKARDVSAIRYIACADIDLDRAAAAAAELGTARACRPEELLAAPDIDLIVNVTPPLEHARLGLEVLASGKHLYTEKPLADGLRPALRMLSLARRRGLRVGCAPDTFMTPALSTARRLLDAGLIGKPFAAAAKLAMVPPESWHPNPAFFYQRGAGPLLDMGPYYVTALVFLLGPVARAGGLGAGASIHRQDPASGQTLEPQVATHEVGLMEFAAGVIATLSVSFDVIPAGTPHFELYGSEGTLRLPDPSFETGEVLAYRRTTERWREHRLDALDALPARCAGVVDMATAIAEQRPHRASGELGFHVLEALLALRRSATLGRMIRLHSRCDRPDPLPEAPGGIACDPEGEVR